MVKLYNKDRSFDLPTKFTALNGAAQTIKIITGDNVHLDVKDTDEHIFEAENNLLLILDVLRSNGAQPIITEVEGKSVTITVEQTWCYGARGDRQVSAANTRNFANEAIADIKNLFKNVKRVSATGEVLEYPLDQLVSDVEIVGTIGDFMSIQP